MKTSFIFASILAGLLSTSMASAQVDSSKLLATAYTKPLYSSLLKSESLDTRLRTTHAPSGQSSVELVCKNPKMQSLKVTICDANGSILYTERLKAENQLFRRMYDLSPLGAGEYKFVIDNGDQRVEKHIFF